MGKQQETGITVLGNAKLGKALVEEAIEKNRKQLQDRVVATVQQKLVQLEEQRIAIANANASIELLEAQVAALNTGKFQVERSGAIKFNDENLHKTIAWLSECQQCGYRKTVLAPV